MLPNKMLPGLKIILSSISLLTLQLFESAITPDFVAVYTACQLPIGRIAVLG